MDFAPGLRLLLLAGAIALLPLGWIAWRLPRASARERVTALLALTAFLTFDLIVFGSFTRLSDSGLGCPDWPGCYGHASPIGAAEQIAAAHQAQPTGPVSWPKAWIEMIHRYLAMTVGALIVAHLLASIVWRRQLPLSPSWALSTLVWVLVQGLFGALTVTWKLNPAIVTLHLLGGMGLLALLVVQLARMRASAAVIPQRSLLLVAAALLVLQLALGAWVSSNYAVLACTGFPACNGQWWPEMDFTSGFTVARELGRSAEGGYLPFAALVAIHMTHRLFALLVTAVLLLLAFRLWRQRLRRPALALLGLTWLQVASGLSNVVLGWPLAAALLHSAGAAALVALLAWLLANTSANRGRS